MKNINVILIDSDTKTLRKVKINDVESFEFKMKWSRLMGSDKVDEVLYPQRDSLRVDSNSMMMMMSNPEKINYFSFNKGNDIFPGNGIICGMGKRGEPTDVHMSIDEVKPNITFHNHYDFTQQFN